MKYSKYNYVMVLHDNTHIIYNTASDGILAIVPELYSLLLHYCHDISSLKSMHPSLFKALLERQMIVGKDIDEYAEVVSTLKKEMNDTEFFHITINPTLDCNLRCWYCYEDKVMGSIMDTQILNATKKFIDRCFSDKEIRHIVISFFGGEPLLYYRKIVKPLIEHARLSGMQTGKNVDFYMTTNGLKLQEQILIDLNMMETIVDFQIPLDGGRDMHDKTKHLKSGIGTYQKVYENVLSAVRHKFPVTIRCNYTADNIGSFVQVAEDFKKEAANPLLRISFHKVWQEEENEALSKLLYDVKSTFYRYGYHVEDSRGQKGMCYADKKNSIVINYDGTVYKCTARKFNDKTCIGQLNTDGSISYNNNFLQIKDCKYKSSVCKDCIIFPICMQTCSQNVVEAADPTACVADNSHDTMDMIIRARLRNITNFDF